MDLYVGAGGLGFLDHVSQLPDGTPDPNGWVGGCCCAVLCFATLWPSACGAHSLQAVWSLLLLRHCCCTAAPAVSACLSLLPPRILCCLAALLPAASPPGPCRVQTRTDWACDYEDDMAQTFKANNQHSHVSTL